MSNDYDWKIVDLLRHSLLIAEAERDDALWTLEWVRGHGCCVPGCCTREPIEAAHVRSSMDGGMGLKPGDNWAISLCTHHHRWQHEIGEAEFEDRAGIDMKALAMEFAAKSPHRNKFRRTA